MADPISSLAPNNSLDCHVEHDTGASGPAPVPASCETPPLACTAEPARGAASSPAPVDGAQTLLARFSPPPALPPPAPSSALPVISYAALSTSSGTVPGGGSRVAATGLNAQIESGPAKGSGVEVATAYAQFGKDTDLRLTLARETVALSGHGYGISVTGEAGLARANLGEDNDDGSIGGNIGASAEAFGLEATMNTPVGSLTYGQSASVGVSGSMGVRDQDHDGDPELCAKFSIPAYTVGACVETFW